MCSVYVALKFLYENMLNEKLMRSIAPFLKKFQDYKNELSKHSQIKNRTEP